MRARNERIDRTFFERFLRSFRSLRVGFSTLEERPA